MAATPVTRLDPGLRRGSEHVKSLGAQATGNASVTARWRLADGTILTIALDLSDNPTPLPPAPLVPSEAEASAASQRTESPPSPFVPSEVEAQAAGAPLFTTDNRFIAWLE